MKKNNTLKPYPLTLLKLLIFLFIAISIAVISISSVLVNEEVKGVLGDMTERVLISKSDLITHRLEMYIDEPRQTNLFLTRLITASQKNSPEFIKQELHHLMTDGDVSMQAIARVSYASSDGEYFAYSQKNATSDPYLVTLSRRGATQLNVYSGDNEASGIIEANKYFNLFTQPWFIKAKSQEQSFWSMDFQHTSENSGLVMSYNTPLRDKKGTFIGVISTDIRPVLMSEYLKTIKPSPGSIMAILNDKGEILASTESKYISDLTALASTDYKENQTTLPTAASYPSFADILSKSDRIHSDHAIPVTLDINNEKYNILSRTLRDKNNQFNWRLVIVSPKNIPYALLSHYRMVTMVIFSAIIFMALLLVSILLVRFTRPLNAIIKKAILLGKEPWEKESNIRLFPEVAELDNELSRTSDLIAGSIQALQKQAEEDHETGLPNFSGLVKRLADGKARNLIALIHLTNFNIVNMTLGAAYATEVARNFIRYLNMRLPQGAILARVRTDKFVIAFPEMMSLQNVVIYEKWLETIFLDRHTAEGSEQQVFQGNAGIVIEEITKERLVPILLNASIATHNAVERGNGEVVRFTKEMHDEALNNFHLHENLRQAITQNEFHLVMQPIVNLKDTENCTEGECLIRWHSKELGFVPPDKFIAVAEQTGLILPIGRWVIETACRELSDFITRGGPKNFKLHINISALQMKDPEFSSYLLRCIARYQLNAENICIELTERTLVDDSGKAIQLLTELRSEGITVALDDFGSGYSSLSYLHELPFDCLKIDRNFVKDVLESKKSEAMISSVLGIAHNFHVPLVAEGIETIEMGDKLHDLGCKKAQGYFYGRPSRFEEWSVENGEFKLKPGD